MGSWGGPYVGGMRRRKPAARPLCAWKGSVRFTACVGSAPFTGAVWTLPTHVASLATWHASLGLCDSDSATNTLCGAGQLIRPLWSKSFPPSAEASCSPDLLRSSINFHSPSFRVGIRLSPSPRQTGREQNLRCRPRPSPEASGARPGPPRDGQT